MKENSLRTPLSTTDGHEYFKWFHSTYENSFQLLLEKGGVTEAIRLFDVRLTAAIGTEISLNEHFRYADSDESQEAYTLMLKLSNIWFSYEALLHACEIEGLLKNPKSKIDALTNDTLSDLKHSYDFFDVQLDFWGMNGRITDDPSHRADLQEYTDHLIKGATSREQKETLADVFNRFTNNDFFSIKEALSFAYAVRNQYAHAGESPHSGVKYLSTKIAALKASFDFIVLFCLRLGELLMDRRSSKLACISP
jgi:hypothetical protein